jgi:hypothetical protein
MRDFTSSLASFACSLIYDIFELACLAGFLSGIFILCLGFGGGA